MSEPITLKHFQRVVDANYNRSKEGLRVCEDLCRFVINDQGLTVRIKKARHDLTAIVLSFGLKAIVQARDIRKDVGRATIDSEARRTCVGDVFYANIQRVKESLRVLEEFAKLKDTKASCLLKKLRYTVYDIEKNVLEQL